jgi:hypothetical protein
MHCSRKHLAEELNNANGTVEDDTMDIMEDRSSNKESLKNLLKSTAFCISKGKAFMILSLIMSNLSENKLLVDMTIS